MHPDRWNRIKEILDVSLRLEQSERDPYLTRVCEGDNDLRTEVESLIEAHEDAGDLFETPPMPAPLSMADPMIGAHLGAYEVLECIGSGGMGSVYRALRADEVFNKEVAIKVVRRGLNLDYVVYQFRRERQILASLEHPNIANLIDGGATPEGLPYFVMEFIRGKPIDLYCDEMRLPLRERLLLFETVCAAVDCAHQRGVVHRDIKHGNILVTANGIPKLLDFGIAKILDADMFPGDRDSRITVGAVMTPEYASPEQRQGVRVTAASDVYSLGVLLYELITGKLPHVPPTGSWDTPGDRGPAPPSSIAPDSHIPSDLDNIVLMAMRREPERRYQNAGQLQADLHRFLEGRPITARKDTVGYRVSKFLRRQRIAVTSVVATSAVIGGVLLIADLRERIRDSGSTPETVPVTSMPGEEREPSLSPDGRRLTFVWNGENGDNPDIYVQALDGTQFRRLTTDRAEDRSPVWSPDGIRIAWMRTGPQETAIFVSPAEGGDHRKIADLFPARLDAVGRQIDWSPDARFLAAPDKKLPEQPFRIVLIQASNGAKHDLTLPPERIIGDVSPAFSPDGKQLAFIRAISSGVNDIYVSASSGGPVRQITFDNRYIVALAWSPDGRSLVFSSDRRGNASLWRVPISGGNPVRVPMIGENASDPAFSRAGRRLVFRQFFMDTNIWRIDVAGRERARKIVSSTQYDSSPDYSPDGKYLVFRSMRSGSNEIWTSDSDGGHPRQLTRYGGPLTGTPHWSPDSREIVYDSRPEGQADIFVIPAGGGSPRRVTQDRAEDVVPSWSRDGRWIYFASNRTGAWQTWRAPSSGGPEEQVTRLGGFAASESPDGRDLYYAKGRGSPGLWRKHLPDGEEEPVLEDQPQAGYWGYWAVVPGGVYFADPGETGGRPGIFYYDFANKRTRLISTVDKPLAVTDSAFAISPDRRYVLYTQIDQSGSDIHMLDPYR